MLGHLYCDKNVVGPEFPPSIPHTPTHWQKPGGRGKEEPDGVGGTLPRLVPVPVPYAPVPLQVLG